MIGVELETDAGGSVFQNCVVLFLDGVDIAVG